MKRCAMCQKRIQQDELVGVYCGKCDHIIGSTMVNLQAEFGVALSRTG